MSMSSPRDSLSGLPDEILGKILSLLPTKVAASTSVLSKRWRNLLGLVDNLCFDDSVVVYPNKEEAISGSLRFCDFVDKTLALLRYSPINKFFSLRLKHIRTYNECHLLKHCVNQWILTAMELGLLEIYLHAYASFFEIETKLLTSNTLVKLTLSGLCDLEVDRVFFPALKSLSLLSVSFNHSLLLDGCPVLEELYIRDGDLPPACGLDVESESIKRLVVFTILPYSQFLHCHVYCEAPSLVYLDYSCYVANQYEFVDLDLLVEARLSLRLWDSTNDYDYSDDDDDDDDYYSDYDDDDNDDYYYSDYKYKTPIFGDVTDLLAAITNITTLHLSPDSLEAFHFCCKSMPVFNNLLNLSIESSKEKGWQVMPLLIESCPNLHTLVIKGLMHRVTNRCGNACACISKKHDRKKNKKRRTVKNEEAEELSCLWTCQVQVLEISEYGGSFQELEQMRHFLGKLECLETVKVSVDMDNDNKSEFLRAYLLALPRISKNCNIQFI